MLQSFDTLTGLKFFVTADPDSRHLDAILREVSSSTPTLCSKTPFTSRTCRSNAKSLMSGCSKLAADFNRR